jgi:hypothetical protein
MYDVPSQSDFTTTPQHSSLLMADGGFNLARKLLTLQNPFEIVDRPSGRSIVFQMDLTTTEHSIPGLMNIIR